MIPTRMDAYQLLHNGILTFARMEQAGMHIDTEYCLRKRSQLTHKRDILEQDFKRTKLYKHWEHVYGSKTNIYSPWQLSNILYNIRKITPAKLTPTGKGSTDIEALAQLNMPEMNILIEIGKLGKLQDYLDGFVREQVDRILHTSLNLHTVRTFRSSSSNPNLQNLPVRDEVAMNIIRRSFLPRRGHQLGDVDYSGIEVRVGACCHKDPTMITYITDKSTDMHRDMAQEIFLLPEVDKRIPEHNVLRQAVKNGFVFPQFYGDYYKNNAESMAVTWGKLPMGRWRRGQGIPMPEGTLSDHLIGQGIKSFDHFVEHVRQVEEDFWENRFKVYKQWKDKWWARYQRKGYFDLLTGFRCSGLMSKKEATNYPIQGSAFHCLLWSLIELDRIRREEKWDTELVCQIHDNLVLDINPSELDHVMKTVHRVTCIDLPKAWPWIIVPLDVEATLCDVDESWNKKQPYKIAA